MISKLAAALSNTPYREYKKSNYHGVSLLPAIQGNTRPDRAFFFQHESNCAIISEEWKLVKDAENAPWELYAHTKDPYEQNNVATSHPEIVHRLEKQWNQWAKGNNVLPLYHGTWNQRIDHFKKTEPRSGRR